MNYTTVVEQCERLTPNIIFVELKLTNPTEIEFAAGQFISVKVADTILRMYSIASSPGQKNKIEIVVDVRPGGPGSLYFLGLSVGDEVEIMGPLGKFNLPENIDKPLIFACTGTGVAPFRSMIHELLSRGFDKNIKLFFGLRFREDQFFVEEFQKLQAEHSNFQFTVTLSRPPENWDGKSGYITKWMEEVPEEEFKCDVYICGWKTVIDSVVEVCKQKNVPDGCIHFENYG